MRVRVLVEAEHDLRQACAFYEARERGLGRRLATQVRLAMRRLGRSAGIHSKVHGYHRIKPLRFPFSIYYAVEGDTVTVVAIIDDRRDPDDTTRRLSQEQ